MPDVDLSRVDAAAWGYNGAVLFVTLALAAVLFHPKVRHSQTWRATVTPLASIVGSGMLVVAPLLGLTTGVLAAPAFGTIVLLSYLVGTAVRYNILHLEGLALSAGEEGGLGEALAWLSQAAKLVLAGAYVIAVAFYLSLLGAFLLRLFEAGDPVLQKAIASVLAISIGAWGWRRGLRSLENLEKYAVNITLAVIGGMIAGLLLYNIEALAEARWALPDINPKLDLKTLRIVLGAFLVVQGFETSRYLRGAYPPPVRTKTMRDAQLIAGTMVVTFLGLATILFDSFGAMDETGVIDLAAEVALLLPLLLILAAMMSQFSSAVADTIGSGGLVEEASRGIMSRRISYLAVAAFAFGLLWSADIFAIIAYASRAFALYYALQCLMACLHAFSDTGGRRAWLKGAGFAALTLIMLLTALFAIPAETAAQS